MGEGILDWRSTTIFRGSPPKKKVWEGHRGWEGGESWVILKTSGGARWVWNGGKCEEYGRSKWEWVMWVGQWGRAACQSSR